MSHTASNAMRPDYDTDEAKVAAVWEYETNPMFLDTERAALDFAQCAASVPNLVTREHIERLREHFTDAEIVEINAVVAFYGFLNRWNDSMATELEGDMRRSASGSFGDKGWNVGKHAAGKALIQAHLVMPALGAGIHVSGSRVMAAWMAGSSPAIMGKVSRSCAVLILRRRRARSRRILGSGDHDIRTQSGQRFAVGV